jgi:hypothetical protein
MGILYNANLTPPMNDISVTSGDADGWVYAVASNLDSAIARPGPDQATRGSADGGTPMQSSKGTKRRKR